MILNKYSPMYEGGRCPLGYEYVESHTWRGKNIDSYCRKIRKFRAGMSPDDIENRERVRYETRFNDEVARVKDEVEKIRSKFWEVD